MRSVAPFVKSNVVPAEPLRFFTALELFSATEPLEELAARVDAVIAADCVMLPTAVRLTAPDVPLAFSAPLTLMAPPALSVSVWSEAQETPSTTLMLPAPAPAPLVDTVTSALASAVWREPTVNSESLTTPLAANVVGPDVSAELSVPDIPALVAFAWLLAM